MNIHQLRIKYQITEFCTLPQYKSAMFRGVFGNSFRKLVCSREQERNCSKCDIVYNCEFAKNFHNLNLQPEVVEEKYRKFSNFPPNFVFYIPEEKNKFAKNEELAVEMTFWGSPKMSLALLYAVLRTIEDYSIDNRSDARLKLFQIIDSSNGSYLYDDNTVRNVSITPLDIKPIDSTVTKGVLRFITHCRITNQSVRVSTEINESILGRRIQERLKLLSIGSETLYLADWHYDELKITKKNLFWEELSITQTVKSKS